MVTKKDMKEHEHKDVIENEKTVGFLYESLAKRDLRIYMENLGGKLCHFRDNVTGLEVDSVLEFENGDYALCEVKLSESGIEDAKKFY